MSTKWSFAVVALCLFSAALLVADRAASQSAQPAPSAQQAGAQQPGSAQSGYVLKVTTRLVTLDLIATILTAIRCATSSRRICKFLRSTKRSKKSNILNILKSWQARARRVSSAHSQIGERISNQLPLDQLKIPPTVLLMDSLNTQTSNQLQGRAHMIQLLRTLPPDTPIAVFLLGSSLRILQGFTSDGTLLRAALDRAVTGTTVEQNPLLDTQNTSSYIENSTAGIDANLGLQSQLGEVQNFEKEEYSMTVDLRAKETLGAMAQIAQYLSGIPGRKNLIWVSESFPLSIAPDPDTGNNPFAGIRTYADQVKLVANVLTDVQVAVYPMDVRGLQANQSLSASQNIKPPPESNDRACDRRPVEPRGHRSASKLKGPWTSLPKTPAARRARTAMTFPAA